jgi:hypothetical protein
MTAASVCKLTGKQGEEAELEKAFKVFNRSKSGALTAAEIVRAQLSLVTPQFRWR